MGIPKAALAAPTRRQKVEAREAAILSAAHDVLAEHGFEATRMTEIGRRAGVSEATIYTYFESKAALMEAVVVEFWRALTIDAAAAVANCQNPLEQLRVLAEFHVSRIIRDRRYLGLTGKIRNVFGDGPEAQDLARNYVHVFDAVFQRCVDKSIFRTGVALRLVRDVFFGALEYSARTAILRDKGYPEGAVENLVMMFVGAYGADSKCSANDEVNELDEQRCLVERLEAAVARLEALQP